MREARPLGQPLEPRTPANVLHLCTWNIYISIYLYWNKVKKRKICMAERSQPRTTALSQNGLSQIWNIYMYIWVIEQYISIYIYTYLYAWSTAVGTAPRTENTCKRTTFVYMKYIYKYLSILKQSKEEKNMYGWKKPAQTTALSQTGLSQIWNIWSSPVRDLPKQAPRSAPTVNSDKSAFQACAQKQKRERKHSK